MGIYRPNAAIVVFRADGKVLLCERKENYVRRWQFPQGGIDEGETPLEAAKRELFEETSITSVKFVTAYPQPLKYEFPERVKQRLAKRGYINDGQEQYWHLFLFEGKESEINIRTKVPEFRSYQWINIADVPELVVRFKRKNYEIITTAFAKEIKKYLEK